MIKKVLPSVVTIAIFFAIHGQFACSQDVWINAAGEFFDVPSNWADGSEPSPLTTARQ